jgi:hypothetical protein
MVTSGEGKEMAGFGALNYGFLHEKLGKQNHGINKLK